MRVRINTRALIYIGLCTHVCVGICKRECLFVCTCVSCVTVCIGNDDVQLGGKETNYISQYITASLAPISIIIAGFIHASSYICSLLVSHNLDAHLAIAARAASDVAWMQKGTNCFSNSNGSSSSRMDCMAAALNFPLKRVHAQLTVSRCARM